MITLDATTKKLEVVLEAAKTTNDCEFHIYYYDLRRDRDSSTQEPIQGHSYGATNGTTTVTLLAAPSSGVTRNVSSFSIYNKDTVTQRVVVKMDISATDYIIINASLLTKETLIYEADGGYQIL